jgi:glycerate kinase
VTTNFLDAAEIFAAQKGATATQIKFLTTRLTGTAEHYRQRFNVDVTRVAGSGAAGGLAGGLFALGATLMPGFDIVAEEVGLDDAIERCDVIITGEGRLDDTSFDGKVVGSIAALGKQQRKTVHAICGDVHASAHTHLKRLDVGATSLRETFGDDGLNATTRCVEQAAAQWLAAREA